MIDNNKIKNYANRIMSPYTQEITLDIIIDEYNNNILTDDDIIKIGFYTYETYECFSTHSKFDALFAQTLNNGLKEYSFNHLTRDHTISTNGRERTIHSDCKV